MDYKKLAAVLTFQGKEAVAKKICKEKIIPNNHVSLFFSNGTKETFRKGSIIKLSFNYLNENNFIRSSKPVMNFDFYPLAPEPEKPTHLLLFYPSKSRADRHILSDGIKEVKYQSIDWRQKTTGSSSYWEIIDLDREFYANPELHLAIVIESENVLYKGRFDRFLSGI